MTTLAWLFVCFIRLVLILMIADCVIRGFRNARTDNHDRAAYDMACACFCFLLASAL